MPLVYRSNAGTIPQWTPPLEPEFTPHHGDNYEDWRPRVLRFKRPVAMAPAKVEPILTAPDGRADTEDTMTKTKAKKAKAKKTTIKAAAKPGVIATTVDLISRDNGASADEITAILAKKFPDRPPEGMRKTVLIQAARHSTKRERDEKRGGVVYYKRRH